MMGYIRITSFITMTLALLCMLAIPLIEAFGVNGGSKERPSDSLWQSLLSTSAKEQNSPMDRIKESQIHVYKDKVVIDLEDAQWASFTDTNSMDPVIDVGSHALQIIPKSPEEIQEGDIVSYRTRTNDATIIHRVKKVDNDSEGWYAIMKGDNLNQDDPEKVRFDQVKRVLVAIIY